MAPIDKKLLDDPNHWRHRAEEARIHADQLDDLDARRMTFDIAASYELTASRAEERLCWPASFVTGS